MTRSLETPAAEHPAVTPWADTIRWIMAQASMGVLDPYSQLPPELAVPREASSAHAQDDDAPGAADGPEPPPESAIGTAAILTGAPPREGAPAPSAREDQEPADDGPEGPAGATNQPGSKAPAVRPRLKVPRWEEAAREQTLAAVRKFADPLRALLERDANEGDTRLLITDLLCEGLGYDKYADLTTEYMVRQDFADYGVRIDRQLVAFIEVKRVSQKLNERHLRQVQMYAVNEGIEWMVLTNGQIWQVYHLTGGLPVVVDLALDVDLLGPESAETKASKLFYLHHESLKRRQIEEVWRHSAATAPELLLDVILSEPVLDLVRREVKKRTGTATSTAVLRKVIRTDVAQPKLLDRISP
ncbi:type I restriction enzyme HsdR N-terminal domain-containing protein [Sinomonas cellulolyticus]|uniref:Type I restriction enzyme HsdR N-terminal domain-containing protein n=1 Tax=Sinomonas cellulolyticus TaxID=2801916 RepID=A0ABS1K181_9MICC|nr:MULTISPECIES: type I restriction enzyme HsdR N-terminal domain-containing protein [Sinomonas]MBL0705137.1 type I restriction enzyme HsdR N-terminal domain-containing protein [Sinomonas cellulolyticus]